MNEYYKKCFERLAAEIRKEKSWAEERLAMEHNATISDLAAGANFAYGFLLRMAEKMEKGNFDFDPDNEWWLPDEES